MMPGVTIISQKASVASIYKAEIFRLGTEFLGSKEHLDWLKMDLNVAKIITVQDYKSIKS